MISLLIPTRERVGLAWRFIDSVAATVTPLSNVEMLFYVTLDDPELDGYLTLGENYKEFVTIHTGPEIFLGIAWDTLAGLSKGDYLFQMEDEIICRTPHWDTLIVEAHERAFPDKIGLTYCDDALRGDEKANVPMVHRIWRDIVGYFLPPFEHFYNSATVEDIARRIGRIHYCPDILLQNTHWTQHKFKDATTKRHREYAKNQVVKRDKKRYEMAREERVVAAQKLLAYIETTSKRRTKQP